MAAQNQIRHRMVAIICDMEGTLQQLSEMTKPRNCGGAARGSKTFSRGIATRNVILSNGRGGGKFPLYRHFF